VKRRILVENLNSATTLWESDRDSPQS
jgi:hypothetical protein